MSDQPDGIWGAILAFQADPPVIKKTKSGHQSKYADLVQLNEVVLPRLNALGIVYTAVPTMTEDDKFRLRYELRHVPSGETIVGYWPLKMSENPQHMGSATTYARRYALLAALDIAAEDEDDDGQAAAGRGTAQRAAAPAKKAAAPAKATAQRASTEPPPLPSEEPQQISPAQSKMMFALLRESGRGERDDALVYIAGVIGREIESTKELSSKEASSVIDALKGVTDTGSDDWPDAAQPADAEEV